MYEIELTKSQIENLIDFFEINFIDTIRQDTDIDSIGYVCDMCNLHQSLKKSLEESE